MDDKTTRKKTKLPAPLSQPCKKRGRPPKAKAQVSAMVKVEAPTHNVAKTQSYEPTANIKTEYEPTNQPVTPFQCRRSKRSKVTKFDVRNLLKKYRKTNQNQADSCQDVNDSNTSKDDIQETTEVDALSTQSSLKQTKCQNVAQLSVLPQDSCLLPPNDSEKHAPMVPRVLLRDVAKYGIEKAYGPIAPRIRKPKTNTMRKLVVRIKRIKLDVMDLAPAAKSTLKTAEEKQMEVTETQTKRHAETEANTVIKTEPLAITTATNVDIKPHIIKSTQPANPYEASSKPNRIVTANVNQQRSLETPSLCPNSVMIEKMSASAACSEQRRSKRYGLRSKPSSSNSGKPSLEHIFAEIVTKSTNSILKTESFESKNITGNPQQIDLIDHNISNRNMDVDLEAHFELESVKQVPSNDVPLDPPKVVTLETLLETKQLAEEEIQLQSEMETLQEPEKLQQETGMVQQQTESLHETVPEALHKTENEVKMQQEAETVHKVQQKIDIKLEGRQETEQQTKKLQEAETEQELEAEPLPGTFAGPEFLQEMESQKAEANTLLDTVPELVQKTQQETEMSKEQDDMETAQETLEAILDLVLEMEMDQETQQETEILNEQEAESLSPSYPVFMEEMETAKDTLEEPKTLLETIIEFAQIEIEIKRETQKKTGILNEQDAVSLPPMELIQTFKTEDDPKTLLETVPELVQVMETDQETQDEADIKKTEMLKEQNSEILSATEAVPEPVKGIEFEQEKPQELQQEAEMLQEPAAVILPETEKVPKLEQVMKTKQETEIVQEHATETLPEVLQEMRTGEGTLQETELQQKQQTESLSCLLPETQQKSETVQEVETKEKAMTLQKTETAQERTLPKMMKYVEPQQTIRKESQAQPEIDEVTTNLPDTNVSLAEPIEVPKPETPQQEMKLEEMHKLPNLHDQKPSEVQLKPADEPAAASVAASIESIPVAQPDVEVVSMLETLLSQVESTVEAKQTTNPSTSQSKKRSHKEKEKAIRKLKLNDKELNAITAEISSAEKLAEDHPLGKSPEKLAEDHPLGKSPEKLAEDHPLGKSPENSSTSPLNNPPTDVKTEPESESERKRSSSKRRSKRRHSESKAESQSSQQSSEDSNCSTQGAKKRKSHKQRDELQLCLIETESSESTSSGIKMKSCGLPTPTTDLDAQYPLKNMKKFIKLLKQKKVEEDEEGKEQPKKPDDEFAQHVANMETPASTPSTSPQPQPESESQLEVAPEQKQTQTAGVRRSNRIKKKPQLPKTCPDVLIKKPSTSISMTEQLAELAQIEAINEQFLRNEGLNTFQIMRDNYYRCARQVSQENAEMQCDCLHNGDDQSLGQLYCGSGCINRMLMIECGPLCSNGTRCTNKRFQQHQSWPCRVFRTDKKGCGITAELEMPPGQFIMEYVGEVIDSEGFERRQHMYSRDQNRHYYFMALRGEAVIDATAKGNISRYINHSCSPNAETQKWTVNGELRIGFFSLKTIQAGEEITFDYQYQRYGRVAQRCYCESSNCRGWIGGEPDSDEAEQQEEQEELQAQEHLSDSEPEELRHQRSSKKTKLSKTKSSQQKLSKQVNTRKQRKEQSKYKDREYRAGRWLRPSKNLGRHVADTREDPDVLDQLTMLNRSGLKNQADTLRISRCMVRVKLRQTRLQLLGVLTRGERACRRLFLDYHGLRLLHGWISESGSDNLMRLALLEALESLPIPNRSMLKDSRVYQAVQLWCSAKAKTELLAKESEQVHQRMLELLKKWDSLPETFRIPKRERIDQLQEHENEADGQDRMHHAVTALEDSNSNIQHSDRYRQDRFRRDKPVSWATVVNSQRSLQRQELKGSNDRTTTDTRRSTISKELRRSLFEQKVAKNEAEKRLNSEEQREHEERCKYFGADPSTDPKQLPFYENRDTKEWFNKSDQPVAAPLLRGNENYSESPETDHDAEYTLPKTVEPLPPSWHWGTAKDGSIYYFNVRKRIPQWEPPNAQQRLEKLVDTSSSDEEQGEKDPMQLISIKSSQIRDLSPKSLKQFTDDKVRERRDLRRNQLTTVREISPRREADRLGSLNDSRRYKENKERIRRRKELYRQQHNPESQRQPQPLQSGNSLAIPRHLYSSDENEEDVKSQSVAQTEALQQNKTFQLPKHDANINKYSPAAYNKPKSPPAQPETKVAAPAPPETDITTEASRKRRLSSLEGHKSSRTDREKLRNLPEKSTPNGRDARDKFLFEISGHVAEYLRPFRKQSCKMGYITSEEDYNFLINRLSQHIITKEMRYCETTGQVLACTESVRKKSHEFVNIYMVQRGVVYKRPQEPDMDS